MAARKSVPSQRVGWWKGWLGRILRVGLISFVVGVVAVVIAVATAYSTLPSYSELKSSPNGQMIRVHAADGTVIVSDRKSVV